MSTSKRLRHLETVEDLGAGAALPHNILSATHSDAAVDAVTRGSLIYGNATPAWDELVLGGISGSVLTRDATDALWSAYALSGTAGQTYTLPAAGGTLPGGSGTAGRVAEWATANTLQASTLIKAGAGVLTLSAAWAYTLTVPETMTAAGRNVANTFTAAQTITLTSASALLVEDAAGADILLIDTATPYVRIGGGATQPIVADFRNSGGDAVWKGGLSNDLIIRALANSTGEGIFIQNDPSDAGTPVTHMFIGGLNGRVGINTTSPASRIHVVESATTAGVITIATMTATGSGANGDGGAIYLLGKSSTTAAQDMASISWLWTDATHASRTARLQFDTFPAGSAVGHSAVWNYAGVAGTAITVIANGTGDVSRVATFVYTVYAVTGADSSGGTVSLAVNSSFIIYNDGTDALTLAVAADGSVTVQRTAGADTFDVSLLMTWQ